LETRNIFDPQHQVYCFLAMLCLYWTVGSGISGKIVGSPTVGGEAAVSIPAVHLISDSVERR
jgi:hypothetical protein